jgi:hypothetical protein
MNDNSEMTCNGSWSSVTCRFQSLRRLRRGSPPSFLLGLWVRILPGLRMSVSCECCVLSGRVFCDDLITHPEKCDREAVTIRRTWPTRSCSAMQYYIIVSQDFPHRLRTIKTNLSLPTTQRHKRGKVT